MIVSPEEWQAAQSYFADNPNQFKKRKKEVPGYQKGDTSTHSFYKFGDKIVAVGPQLGEGAFATVKRAQGSQGEPYKLRLEKMFYTDSYYAYPMQMLSISADFMANGIRSFEKPKQIQRMFSDQPNPVTLNAKKQICTLGTLYEGEELFDILDKNMKNQTLSQTQMILLAIQCCVAVQQLHNKNQIHADLKPEHFIVDLQGNSIKVNTIDHNSSFKLPVGQKFILKTTNPFAVCSPPYAAPEMLKQNGTAFACFATDVYALGKIFDFFNQVMFVYNFSSLCHQDITKRPDLSSVIIGLLAKLAIIQPQPDDATKEIIAQAQLLVKQTLEKNLADSSSETENVSNDRIEFKTVIPLYRSNSAPAKYNFKRDLKPHNEPAHKKPRTINHP